MKAVDGYFSVTLYSPDKMRPTLLHYTGTPTATEKKSKSSNAVAIILLLSTAMLELFPTGRRGHGDLAEEPMLG